MITDAFARKLALMAETQVKKLDMQDGKLDNKISIKVFNDFAEANGLQKIEGQSDTEQIDVATIKESMIKNLCEKHPELADKIKEFSKETSESIKQLEDYNKLQHEDIKSSEPQFGL